MRLGLKKDEVRLDVYNLEWRNEFDRVKNAIIENTNIAEHRIEHIGSTAIIGMDAKPIIDILVGVNDISNFDAGIVNGLKNIGFLRLKVQRPGEIVFARFTDETYLVKTHFIHLVEYKEELWNNLVFFRDYLNSNEDARLEYSKVKKDYLVKSSTGANEYTEHKEAFVKKIFNLRLKGV
ncbi:GrpB family protein [Mesobacillus selenatarsenatis]|uniref:Glutamate-rich protein grpB n=1 Tax=Mesobacillus selenatarsenatis (strain DSM 18680 / JCM 14380 / FERM P-15431 / SF-1) TaxID=1321606 RepID=A0A0A8X297_MESS1|nr:GrpB family protein [Mesobacillus selenatarsenatis]GAM13157.1 glutamate-rich protein grpB [Mesobacillus selenatarsenatis SF-1]